MLVHYDESLPTDTIEARLELLDRLFRLPLRGYVAKQTGGNPVAAEDIVQETFTRAWRFLRENQDAQPWLYTVARRLVIDAHRARKARPAEVALDDLGVDPATDDLIAKLLNAEALRSALLKLSRDHRQVVIELYVRDRAAEEIAARLGVPVGTVRSRSHYAKRALRGYLGD